MEKGVQVAYIGKESELFTKSKAYDLIDIRRSSINYSVIESLKLKNDKNLVEWFEIGEYDNIERYFVELFDDYVKYIGTDDLLTTGKIYQRCYREGGWEYYDLIDDNGDLISVRKVNYMGGAPNFAEETKKKIQTKISNNLVGFFDEFFKETHMLESFQKFLENELPDTKITNENYRYDIDFIDEHGYKKQVGFYFGIKLDPTRG